jgi:hypothetical protein
MGGSTNQSKYDHWIVRDDVGLLHNALVYRQYDAEGRVLVFQVSTACAPSVQQYDNTAKHDWAGVRLPHVQVGDFLIVEWRVREVTSCLQCIVAPGKL